MYEVDAANTGLTSSLARFDVKDSSTLRAEWRKAFPRAPKDGWDGVIWTPRTNLLTLWSYRHKLTDWPKEAYAERSLYEDFAFVSLETPAPDLAV
ncbi:MAG: hypothetical protein HC902_03590 [Calothrix sp. SM1_5_4]|nr:hypothetical protein [Calothrix sp. SM1_5_4]